jgi:hypothetical protein
VYKITALFCLGLCVSLFTGCATRTRMPLLDQAGSISATSEPIYLLTVTLKNDSHPRYQPELLVTYVEKPGAASKADRMNFLTDDLAEDETDSPRGNRYLLRLQLPSSEHVLMGFGANSRHFPFTGSCIAPLLEPIPVQAAGGVYYLGHVNATVRARVGDEFRAGPVIPLLDQAMTGFSGGTFDVVIEDRWAADEAEFLAKFPALRGVVVKRLIMAPFNRDRAQKWWEGEMNEAPAEKK